MAALSWPRTQYLQGNRRRCPPCLGSHLPLSAFLGATGCRARNWLTSLRSTAKFPDPNAPVQPLWTQGPVRGGVAQTSSLCRTLTQLFPGGIWVSQKSSIYIVLFPSVTQGCTTEILGLKISELAHHLDLCLGCVQTPW